MTGSGCADRRVDGVDDPGRPGPAAARRGGRGLSGYGGKTRRYNADKTTPSSTVHHGSPDGARERAIYTGGTRGRFSYDTHPAHTTTVERTSEPRSAPGPPAAARAIDRLAATTQPQKYTHENTRSHRLQPRATERLYHATRSTRTLHTTTAPPAGSGGHQATAHT